MKIDLEILDNLNYFRNKYYTDGGSTENGIIADNLNIVLPLLAKDVEEVVRCKDCVKCEFDGEYGHYWCTEPFGTVGCIGVLGTFYCGFGKKRGNNEKI